MKRSGPYGRKTGFTLVELLVVVAIIALLISILLPSLQQARAQARQLVDATNLRSQGQSAYQYAESSRGFIVRGIAGINQGDEYNTYARALLPYLGYTGHIPEWTPGDPEELRPVFEETPFYQCPDHQDPRSVLDYVANAMPMPYTQKNVDYDNGNTEFNDDEWDGGVAVGDTDYADVSQLDEIGNVRSPADTILTTEVHVSLSTGGDWRNLRFHHFFVQAHLPFGADPRIANDQRHPGGINAVFFDGHAETMGLKEMDPAWPNDYEVRMRWFTTLGVGVEAP